MVDGRDVLVLRGTRVMLDYRIAEAFGIETKRLNEAVTRNPDKFDDRHTFQLTEPEQVTLRSQIATSKPGRGGLRYPPRAFTVKGVARLATVLSTPAALRATDLIIDTFLWVHEQLSQGHTTVAIREPDRFRSSPEQSEQIGKLRSKLVKALDRLLDMIVDVKEQRSVRDVGRSLGSDALQNIQERLRSRGLENSKLEADTNLVLAQAEKMLAEARKADAEAEGLDIANFERRVIAVRRVAEMLKELEPTELIGLLGEFEADFNQLVGRDRRRQ